MGDPSSLFEKILFVGGKGGVGKTTISSALALSKSAEGKTILISTDPAHSLSDLTQGNSSDEIVSLEKNLDVWELNAQVEYDKFREKHQEDFRLILDTSTYLDETDINQFLALAIPGIDEIMGFKSLVDLVKTGTYDYYIVDTAPTGHALRLLFIPEILDQWIKQIASLRWKYRQVQKSFKGQYDPDSGDDMLLDLKKSVLKMRSILKDPNQAEFVIVTKAESMVYQETVDLKGALEDKEISINSLIINNVMQESTSDFCKQVRTYQSTWIEKLTTTFQEKNIIQIPQYAVPIEGLEQLKSVSEELKTIN